MFESNSCCKAGQRILEGQLIADGQSAQEGELALGANVRVAFFIRSW